jgi:hypothetical protein
MALKAEENRVESKLNSKSNFSDVTVGIYADPQANVLNETGDGILVQINMSYSYSYHCGERIGSVDGVRTKTDYLVNSEGTKLKRTMKEIKSAC